LVRGHPRPRLLKIGAIGNLPHCRVLLAEKGVVRFEQCLFQPNPTIYASRICGRLRSFGR
jgi:hypothetical protein